MGYNSAEQWVNLLRSRRNVIAKEMGIAPSNLRWVAAYHNKETNPHVHMLVWSSRPQEPYTDEQFDKLVEIGIPEAQLYKMAGNSVTTNVVTAIGLKLMQEVQKLEQEDKKAKNIFHRIAEIAKRLFSGFQKSKETGEES